MLLSSGELAPVAEPGDPESSTASSTLVSHHGNGAVLPALALAVAEGVDVPMEANVLRRHVVVRAPGGDNQWFELRSHGATLTVA